ncbi:conserved hypothetical protein [Culex quinquefasciatus]|uniref:Uncharacterized protein n=1 Tax=Culex quinquefasciatus TaxID=7176 RepID=B0WYZ2_CULQU|nr:conserved hypothetical protein [Culex quinquefasciatus]|eukprot:XP_001862617.1 conserved hypothetical protein [Culex quinquefasciatus]
MTNSSSQCPDANNDRAVAVTALRSMLADISGSQSNKPATLKARPCPSGGLLEPYMDAAINASALDTWTEFDRTAGSTRNVSDLGREESSAGQVTAARGNKESYKQLRRQRTIETGGGSGFRRRKKARSTIPEPHRTNIGTELGFLPTADGALNAAMDYDKTALAPTTVVNPADGGGGEAVTAGPQTDEHKRSGQSGRRGVLRAQSALGDNGHAANQQHNVAAQLSFFLQCNGESDTANWRCSESAELRLLSVIPNRDPFVR